MCQKNTYDNRKRPSSRTSSTRNSPEPWAPAPFAAAAGARLGNLLPTYPDPFSLSRYLGLNMPYSERDALEKQIGALEKSPSVPAPVPVVSSWSLPNAAPQKEPSPRKRALEPPTDVQSKKTVRARPYQDHSNDPLTERYSHAVGGTFPFVLHTMLNEVEETGLSNFVSWRPHGRAFLVHDVEGFVEHVMPLYFKQTQMPSFLRQLSLYGFTRINTMGMADRGAYYHPHFLRGREDLCVHISRTRIKGGRTVHNNHEPDFYKMQPVGVWREQSEKRHEATDKTTTVDPQKNEEYPAKEEESKQVKDGTMTLDDALVSSTLRGFAPRPLPPMFNNASVATVQNPAAFLERKRLTFQVLSLPIECRETSSPTMYDEVKSAIPSSARKGIDKLSDIPFSPFALSMFGRGHHESTLNTSDDDSFLKCIESMFEEDPVKRHVDEEDKELTSFLDELDWTQEH